MSLDANDAYAWNSLAEIVTLSGHPEEGLADAQKAERLDPLNRQFYYSEEGFAYNDLGRFDKAIAALQRGDQANPYNHAILAHAYWELGREQDARTEVAEVMRLNPRFSLEEWKQRVPRNWNSTSDHRLLDDLRKAGLK